MLPTILLSSCLAREFAEGSAWNLFLFVTELCEHLRSQWLVWCAVEQTDTIKVTRRDGREGAISHPVRGTAMGWPSWSPRPSTLRECRSKSKAKPKLNCLPASSQWRCQWNFMEVLTIFRESSGPNERGMKWNIFNLIGNCWVHLKFGCRSSKFINNLQFG